MAITYTTAEVTSISGNTLVYTVPAGKTAIIMSAVIGNTSGSASSIVDIKLNSTPYAHAKAVPVEGVIMDIIERQILTAGQTIHIDAAGSNLSFRLSIKEIA